MSAALRTCPLCAGLVVPPGTLFSYAGPLCTCAFIAQRSYYDPAPPQGWQCPCCRVVHAPQITRCACAGTPRTRAENREIAKNALAGWMQARWERAIAENLAKDPA